MSATVDMLAPNETQPELAPGMEMTPEELLRLPDGKHYELVDGILVERNMSCLSGVVSVYVIQVLGAYCREKGLGWVLNSEVG
jgi:Uma2 family endonuclease